ncbi:MAG: VWA domain-containing protein [Fimbriimonadales bacterium]|nr:VWA domain-containing protein [Fimbriimonadales bacterium]
MKRLKLAILGAGLFLTGCAPQFRQHPLPAAPLPPHTKVVHVAYFKSDAPQLRNPNKSAFTIRCETPGVQVELVDWKLGKAKRPHRQRALSIWIAWDQSLSLRDTDPERRRFAAGRQLISNLPNDARIGLVNFASLGYSYADYDLRAPMGSSKRELLNALDFLNRSDYSQHGTPLWNTLYYGIPESLANEPAERERWVILFTDGQNQIAVPSRTEYEALQVAQQHRVKLVFVFLGSEATIADYEQVRQTLEYMADATGGTVIAVEQAQDLREAFGEVLDILEYAPCYNLHLQLHKSGGFRRGEAVRLRIQAEGGAERTVTVYPVQ